MGGFVFLELQCKNVIFVTAELKNGNNIKCLMIDCTVRLML